MDGKGVLFVVFFLKFSTIFLAPPPATPTMKSGKHLHLFVMLQTSFGFTRDLIVCNFHASIGYCYVYRVFLIMLSSSFLTSMIESSINLWFPEPQSPAVTHGFRWHTTPFPRRKVPRWPVNFVEIHKGEALQSWDILMRIMILEYETILGVSGYNLISCFHKWMWKSL